MSKMKFPIKNGEIAFKSDVEKKLDNYANELNNLSNRVENINNKFNAQAVQRDVTASGQNDTVVEYWVASDGNSWYRKWASGWIEQGGFIDYTGFFNLKFPAPFKTTDYIIAGTVTDTGSDGRVVYCVMTRNRKPESIDIAPSYITNNYGFTGEPYFWFASGH